MKFLIQGTASALEIREKGDEGMTKPKWHEADDPDPYGVISSEEPVHGDPPHHDFWSSGGSKSEKGHEEDPDQWDAWESDDSD